MSKQIWRPDTCGCVVEEEVINGQKSFSQAIKCADHAAVPDAELYDVLYAAPHGENRRKNTFEGFIRSHPDFGQDEVTPNGTVRSLKPGVSIEWVWTGTGADRVLDVNITGVQLTSPRRSQLETFIAESPFAGRIRVR